jgi:hypothetical protein
MESDFFSSFFFEILQLKNCTQKMEIILDFSKLVPVSPSFFVMNKNID